MRKYLRAIARVNMEKAGIQHINKAEKGGNDSRFALYWREWVKPTKQMVRRVKRGAYEN